MNRTEPTTGDWKREVKNPTHADFARAYRELAERKMNANGLVCVDTAMIHQAADRLESQEQKLELLNGGDFDVIDIPAALAYLESVEEILPHASALIDLIQSLKGTAIELTARAEQAERELRILEPHVKRNCITCHYHDCSNEEEPCFTCTKREPNEQPPKWVYRGQPQDGEGTK